MVHRCDNEPSEDQHTRDYTFMNENSELICTHRRPLWSRYFSTTAFRASHVIR